MAKSRYLFGLAIPVLLLGLLAFNRCTVYQFPYFPDHSMGYAITTPTGKLIIVDGGPNSAAPYLANFIDTHGGKVDTWFITHTHYDHIDAMCTLLESRHDIKVKRIYGFLIHYPSSEDRLVAICKLRSMTIRPVHLGQRLWVDGTNIRVLGIGNPELPGLNNSSVVYRVSDSHKSVLFLGDLDVAGGQKLLDSPCAKFLPSDYCQLAHHGNILDKEFYPVYQAIRPKYALWCCRSSQAKPMTAGWMKQLHAQNYFQDNLIMIR